MAKISKLYETEKTKTVVNRHSTKKSTSYLISGTVEKTTAYCGGAKPSQDLLNKLAKPSSYANKKFYIRTGKVNSMAAKIVKNFTTDSAGVFSIRLKPGIYSIIVEEQLHPIKPDEYANQNQEVDVKCLEEWWAKPYYLLIVKKDRKSTV